MNEPATGETDLPHALESAVLNSGTSLAAYARTAPVLVVFLRHFGCTFCREALADLVRQRAAIEQAGVRIVLVHLAEEAQAAAFFARRGVADLPRVADPDQALYRAFQLRRGSARQLLSPRVVWRGMAAMLHGHRAGRLAGDGFQMPGVFLLRGGRVARAFRHRTAADRPDYCSIVGEG